VLKFDAGGVHIELIEPLSGESPVAKSIAARGEGIHHVCFNVPDVAAFARALKEKGFRPLTEAPRPGASGRSVIFMNPKDAHGVLVELSAPAAGAESRG
jgi:methylmalonyl-CoA/ethylmalonyl-CoA epimerase